MKKKVNLFSTNPEKASGRVAINGVMLASIFVMLGVIFLDYQKFNIIAISEMVLSIPFLFISSLAYAKIGYWKETKLWDILGYFANTFGNFFLINAIGILSFSVSHLLAFLYFGLIIFLFLIFSIINLFYGKPFNDQLFKFSLTLIIIFFGGILPLLL